MANTSPPLFSKQKLHMQKEKRKEEPRMAKKKIIQATRNTQREQRQKYTRWISVSTKSRQACNTNQINSNDFSTPLPYKGMGTPSETFRLMTAVVFASSRPRSQNPDYVRLDVIYSRGLTFMLVVCPVSRVASTLSWPPALF